MVKPSGCPFTIFNATHYNDDGSCRCYENTDDNSHSMKAWGYRWCEPLGRWFYPRPTNTLLLRAALVEDHGHCRPNDDPGGVPGPECGVNYCDICATHRRGHLLVAAHFLLGATECPTLEAVIEHIGGLRSKKGLPHGWRTWTRWFFKNTLKCPACEAYVFTDVPHTHCGNCLYPLPELHRTPHKE